MASNTRADWRLCLIILVTALFVSSSADGYYEYETQTFQNTFWGQPTLKLIVKRQATDVKDNAKQALLSKENRAQTDTSSENSSNPKLGINESGSAVATLTVDQNGSASGNATVTTTAAPTSAPVTMQAPPVNQPSQVVQDFDGNNVTVTNSTEDHHRYYNSTTYPDPDGKKFWVDLDNQASDKVVVHDMLSQSHRRAATIPLTFDFPFYGHLVRNITIATGGFLYTGDYVHSWLAATQYIAPLMANFDTSMSNTSTIKYMDNGTAFTVQWERVSLQDRVNAGNFTFQVTLLSTGDIIFAYKDVPIPVTTILDDAHPVKVGVSDAYIIDRTIFFVRRKTIYEYHKVELKKEAVANGTAIYFSALPTCVSLKGCEACISNSIGFECVWCSTADRCSDGMDRHRQDWLVKGCDKFFVDDTKNCSAATTPSNPNVSPSVYDTTTTRPTPAPTSPPTINPWDNPTSSRVHDDEAEDHEGSSVSSVIGILFLVAMIFGSAGWLFYAYRNPHTPSGQCFIRYRPSQWRWRSGEAHYTAAAIHM